MVGRKELLSGEGTGQPLWPLFSDCPTLGWDVFTLLPEESSTNM